MLQAWHGLDVEAEDVKWLLSSGALARLGSIAVSRVPLSNIESETVDMEGLWEAAATAHGKVVSRCMLLGGDISAEADKAWGAMLSRVSEGKAGDRRDARRLLVLTWMHASLSRCPGRYAASKTLVEEVLQIAQTPESPLLQRVALKCCELILPGSARYRTHNLLNSLLTSSRPAPSLKRMRYQGCQHEIDCSNSKRTDGGNMAMDVQM